MFSIQDACKFSVCSYVASATYVTVNHDHKPPIFVACYDVCGSVRRESACITEAEYVSET